MPIYTALNSKRDVSAQSYAGVIFYHEIRHLSTSDVL